MIDSTPPFLRRLLVQTLVCSVACIPAFVRAQSVSSVIDGYDRGEFAQTVSAMVFDADVVSGWTLYYTTGRHFRVLKSNPILSSQTLAYFNERTPEIVRLRTHLDGRPEVPYAAFTENASSSARVLLRSSQGGSFWHLEAGEHTVSWDGRDNFGHVAASGIYFAHISTPGVMFSRQLVFMK